MKYKLFNKFFQRLIFLVLLFLVFLILNIFAISSIQINVDNINTRLNFKNKYLNIVHDNENISSDYEKKQNDEEIIIVNTLSYFPGIFTFSPTKFLRSLYITDATDYLKNIPGFNFIRNGGTNAEPVFRGMFGSRLRMLMNNGEILGACCARMDPASAYIYPETFDILNLVKGPQTVLLGPVSSTGTLQFERYHPFFNRSEFKLHSSIVLGANNKMDKNIDSIIGSKYGYVRLIGNVSSAADYRDGNGNRVRSSWYKWNADTILSLNFTAHTSCEINIGQGNGNAKYVTKFLDGLCFARESYGMKIGTIDVNDTVDKMELYTWYNYVNHLMSDNLDRSIITFSKKQQCDNNCMNNNVDRCIWGVRGIIVNQWNNIECHSGMDIQIDQHRKIGCGVDWITDIITRDAGIFSELIFSTLSNRKFVGGIRLEYYDVSNANNYIFNQYNAIYPTGFIRYEVNTYPLLYYIGIGTSKRFPDYWELSHINFNKYIHVKNNFINQHLLKPECTVQIDAGTFFQSLKINGWISSYIGYVRNFILYTHDETHGLDNNIISLNNIDAQVCGVEAELNYFLNKNWCIKSNVTWTRGFNINQGCSLPKIPPLEGMFLCQWQYGCCNANVLWRAVMASKCQSVNHNSLSSSQMKFENFIKTAGFGILSAHMEWKYSKYYVLNIGVDNVFNHNYREYFNFFRHQEFVVNEKINPVYEPGRVWWIKMEILL